MTEPQIAYTCAEILKALVYIHSNQRVHRDLRHATTFLGGLGNVKIADLGGTVRHQMYARPYWLAPESISKEAIGPEVDIWALGILILEMAGNPEPYKDETTTKTLFLLNTQGSPNLVKPSAWSVEFKDFLSCCLVLDPHSRSTASELLQHPFLKKSCNTEAMKSFAEKLWKRSTRYQLATSDSCTIL